MGHKFRTISWYSKTLVTKAKVIMTQNKHNTEYRIKEKDAGNTE